MPPRSAYFAPGVSSISGKPVIILFTITILLLLAGMIAIPVIVARSVRTQLDAETRLHALIVTAHTIRAFANTQDPPRWPSSWDELATVTYTDHAWIHWPRDRTLIEEHVTVDFDIRLEAVLSTQTNSLEAVRPNGITFTGWQHDVLSILLSP